MLFRTGEVTESAKQQYNSKMVPTLTRLLRSLWTNLKSGTELMIRQVSKLMTMAVWIGRLPPTTNGRVLQTLIMKSRPERGWRE